MNKMNQYIYYQEYIWDFVSSRTGEIDWSEISKQILSDDFKILFGMFLDWNILK